MTSKPLLIPVLLLCMLFNGNLFTLLVAAKTYSLLPFTFQDQQSDTLPSSEMEIDGDGDTDVVEYCCFCRPVLALQIPSAKPLPFTGSCSHELIYILHNLRI